MAAGAPATAHAQIHGVRCLADENLARADARPLSLGVAFQTQVVVTLKEELGIDGTVRLMTDGAAFAQRFVLENEGPRLFAVAFGAGLI